MNVLVPYNWLVEVLETNARPEDIQKYVSLSGPSIERIVNHNNEPVFDVEITSNRIDSASILGFARECSAILPEHGFKAVLKEPYIKQFHNKIKKTNNKLTILIDKSDLCTRFTAIVFENIVIKESPEFIKNRLGQCGIQSINNVVDISNYLMLLFGQPVHMFDYDKIAGALLRTRLSKRGEGLVTLDKESLTLPGNDIVIEDADKKIIDLCGIMGGLNSAISKETKRIVFFLQTYNKTLIRRTSMITGKRTPASTYFEKGLDEEQITKTMDFGIQLIKEYSQGDIASQIYNIYPNPYVPKKIKLNEKDINKLLKTNISYDRILNILNKLGFKATYKNKNYIIIVPSFRAKDINIKEDIIEEIARILGYDKIPAEPLPFVHIKQPYKDKRLIEIISLTKKYLYHLGGREIITYSMYSKEELEKFGLVIKTHVHILNAMTKDIEYLRQSIIPSLLNIYYKNTSLGYKVPVLFESGNIFYHIKNDVIENPVLTVISEFPFLNIKEYTENILKIIQINNTIIHVGTNRAEYLKGSNLIINSEQTKKELVSLGILSSQLLVKYDIHKPLTVIEFNLKNIIDSQEVQKVYQKYFFTAKVNLEVTIKKDRLYNKLAIELDKRISSINNTIISYSYLSLYKNWISFRFTFQNPNKNITQLESQKILNELVSGFEVKM